MTHTESALQLVSLGVTLTATFDSKTFVLKKTNAMSYFITQIDSLGVTQKGFVCGDAETAVNRWMELAFPLRKNELCHGILNALMAAPEQRKPGRKPLNNSYQDGYKEE